MPADGYIAVRAMGMFSDIFESVCIAHGAGETRVSSRSQSKSWDEGADEEDEEEIGGKAKVGGMHIGTEVRS